MSFTSGQLGYTTIPDKFKKVNVPHIRYTKWTITHNDKLFDYMNEYYDVICNYFMNYKDKMRILGDITDKYTSTYVLYHLEFPLNMYIMIRGENDIKVFRDFYTFTGNGNKLFPCKKINTFPVKTKSYTRKINIHKILQILYMIEIKTLKTDKDIISAFDELNSMKKVDITEMNNELFTVAEFDLLNARINIMIQLAPTFEDLLGYPIDISLVNCF